MTKEKLTELYEDTHSEIMDVLYSVESNPDLSWQAYRLECAITSLNQFFDAVKEDMKIDEKANEEFSMREYEESIESFIGEPEYMSER